MNKPHSTQPQSQPRQPAVYGPRTSWQEHRANEASDRLHHCKCFLCYDPIGSNGCDHTDGEGICAQCWEVR